MQQRAHRNARQLAQVGPWIPAVVAALFYAQHGRRLEFGNVLACVRVALQVRRHGTRRCEDGGAQQDQQLFAAAVAQLAEDWEREALVPVSRAHMYLHCLLAIAAAVTAAVKRVCRVCRVCAYVYGRVRAARAVSPSEACTAQ